MKKYLRFGQIPKGGRSINFMKLSLADNSYFSYCIDIEDVDAAYSIIPEHCFEAGVSCFELDEAGKVVLDTEALMKDFEYRKGLDEKVFIVFGEEVGRGYDGEPLVKVESFEETDIGLYD